LQGDLEGGTLIRLEFDDGSKIEVPDNVKEMDEVTVIDRGGKRTQTIWGSVISQTNGEVLNMLERARPSR